jgi:ketosteroid isomerase-like protein
VSDPAPPDLDDLVEVAKEATVAFLRPDMRRYFALTNHTEDFTLMAPEGGPVHGSFEVTDDVISDMEAYFRGGEAELEVIRTYASGDLAVLVGIERQHGKIGDRPAQDWSLRVTLAFRRDRAGWRLVHRHADALVHPITFDHLGELARGEWAPGPADPGGGA